jgi:hypothetical protein
MSNSILAGNSIIHTACILGALLTPDSWELTDKIYSAFGFEPIKCNPTLDRKKEIH